MKLQIAVQMDPSSGSTSARFYLRPAAEALIASTPSPTNAGAARAARRGCSRPCRTAVRDEVGQSFHRASSGASTAPTSR